MIKLGTTSKKKKNIAVFLFFYAKNFEKKMFKKLSINWRYQVKTIFSDITTFIEINEVLHPKRKKILLFFLFFYAKNLKKIKYQIRDIK